MSIHDDLVTCRMILLRQAGHGDAAPRRTPGLSDDEELAMCRVNAMALRLLWDAFFVPEGSEEPAKAVKFGPGSLG